SWTERRLNPRTVTDTTVGGQNATDTTSNLSVSAADGSLLYPGYVIADSSQDPSVAEYMFVNSVTPPATAGANATVNVARGFNGTTKVTHTVSAVYQIIAAGQIPGSEMVPDQRRIPGLKQNLIPTQRR